MIRATTCISPPYPRPPRRPFAGRGGRDLDTRGPADHSRPCLGELVGPTRNCPPPRATRMGRLRPGGIGRCNGRSSRESLRRSSHDQRGARLWQPDPRTGARGADQLSPQFVGAPCRATCRGQAIISAPEVIPRGRRWSFAPTSSTIGAGQRRAMVRTRRQMIHYSFIDNSYIAGPDSKGALAFPQREPPRSRLVGRQQHERGVVPTIPGRW